MPNDSNTNRPMTTGERIAASLVNHDYDTDTARINADYVRAQRERDVQKMRVNGPPSTTRPLATEIAVIEAHRAALRAAGHDV